MLSRVANNLYWLSRYLERAENLARLVDVNRYDELDAYESEDSDELAHPLIIVTNSQESYAKACEEEGKEAIDVVWFVTFSDASGESIRQCIAQARENARMVRDQISEDIWLELNTFHLFIQSEAAEQLWAEQPEVFYRRTIRACLLFSGLINATISRDEGWNFIQTGKFLERADKTTRVLDMLAFEEAPDRGKLISALRSCSAFSAFRSESRAEITLQNVISFLLFSPSFPRSVRFCLREVDQHLHAISGTPANTFSNEAERLNGSTLAQLNFSGIESVLSIGYHAYLDGLQGQFNQIGDHIYDTYIRLPQETETLSETDSWYWQQHQQQQQQQ